MARGSIYALFIAFVLAACGAHSVGSGDYEIRATLVDAETGAEVPRERIYVYAYDDATGEKAELEPAGSSSFEVRMHGRPIRLYIRDSSDRYEPYDAHLEVPIGGIDHVVRLVPTHFVLVRGYLLEQRGTELVPVEPSEAIGGTPLVSFGRQGGTSWDLDLLSGGRFEVRLPRERLQGSLLDTSLRLETPILDLSGVTDDVVERELHLVP